MTLTPLHLSSLMVRFEDLADKEKTYKIPYSKWRILSKMTIGQQEILVLRAGPNNHLTFTTMDCSVELDDSSSQFVDFLATRLELPSRSDVVV